MTEKTLRWGVGLFLTLSLGGAGTFLGYRFVQEYWLDRPWKLSARLAQGHGLVAGSEVKLNGVPVGSVQSVDVAPDHGIQVAMGVKFRYRKFITDQARFSIKQPAFLGDPWIEIESPQAGESHLREGAAVFVAEPKEGFSELGLTREKITAIVDDARSILNQTNAILSDLHAGKGTAGKLLNDPGIYDESRKTLTEANTLLADLREGKGTVGKMFKDSKLYDELSGSLEEVRKLAESLRSQEGQAKETLAQLNSLLKESTQTADNLKQIAGKINSGQGTIGKLVNDDKIFDETRRILAQLRETLEDLREQTPISTFMGALFGAF